jgi:uncharacterized membrane protein YfcA
MLEIVVLLVVSFVAGTYGTIVGAGGGFLLVPLLLLLRPDLNPAAITTISLGAVFFNGISGTIAYTRQKRIDYKSSLLFAAATVPTAILGALAVNLVPRQAFQMIFGVFLVLVAIFIWIRPGIARRPVHGGLHFYRELTDARGTKYEWSYNLLIGMVVSFFVGFLAALLGVGGGIILVPVMVTFLAFPAAIATATSTFTLVFTSASATVTHLIHGDFAGIEQSTLIAAAAMIFGAQVGARLSQRMSGQTIVRALAVALGFVGVRLFIGAL